MAQKTDNVAPKPVEPKAWGGSISFVNVLKKAEEEEAKKKASGKWEIKKFVTTCYKCHKSHDCMKDYLCKKSKMKCKWVRQYFNNFNGEYDTRTICSICFSKEKEEDNNIQFEENDEEDGTACDSQCGHCGQCGY